MVTASLSVSPPSPNELEVSLFGPGYGECIVLHLGKDDWAIVDSCINEPRARPVALDYLESMGVNVQSQVRLIVATHWHDDHIRGIAQLVEAVPSADFACTAALHQEDFVTVAEATRSDLMMESSGVDEFRRILQALSNSARIPTWTLGGLTLFKRQGTLPASIVALTPSNEAYNDSLKEIARLLPAKGEPKRRAWPSGPNHGSIVLWVSVGDSSFLLGADLEEDSGRRWSALLSSAVKPAGSAKIFKVPHHGSAGADHPPVWEELVSAEAITMLTPFERGGVSLPTANDKKRICAYGRQSYSAADPRRPKSRRRNSAVEKTIKEVVGELSPANGPLGHVRARKGPADWTVELFGQAYDLCA